MSASASISGKEKLRSLLRSTDAVVFDFDGLLADSEPFHYRAYNEVFERYGHTLDRDEYWVEWTSKGKGIAGEIQRHNLDLGVDPVEMRQQKFSVYSRFCQSGAIKLFPETMRLADLLGAHHKIAIASGSWTHDIRAILKNAGALHHFPVILGKESAPREKPNPDIFLKAAESLGCSPSQCLVVEDALKGLDAASQAGMACIIIRTRLNEGIDFNGADLILPSLAELLSSLDSPS